MCKYLASKPMLLSWSGSRAWQESNDEYEELRGQDTVHMTITWALSRATVCYGNVQRGWVVLRVITRSSTCIFHEGPRYCAICRWGLIAIFWPSRDSRRKIKAEQVFSFPTSNVHLAMVRAAWRRLRCYAWSN